jgi:uncharacterized protein YndB with AHSA1/START domain
MAETFVARASITINASGAKVWDALVNPETIKQYMPVTGVDSEWREGSAIVWKSEFQDKPFEVRGTVLRVAPGRLLEYDHSLPIFRASGAAHPGGPHQRVTIELRHDGAQTHLSVSEQNNKTRRELEHSEGSWRMVLHGVKALLEGTSVVPMRSEERR